MSQPPIRYDLRSLTQVPQLFSTHDGLTYDVRALWRIAEKKLVVVPVCLHSLSAMFGVGVTEPQRAMAMSLQMAIEQPLLGISISSGVVRIVDGWHRAYRLYRAGHEVASSAILTQEQATAALLTQDQSLAYCREAIDYPGVAEREAGKLSSATNLSFADSLIVVRLVASGNWYEAASKLVSMGVSPRRHVPLLLPIFYAMKAVRPARALRQRRGARLRVLVACEFSGTVREAFARRGWDAWSCDLLPSEIEGQHITGDVRPLLREPWDLLIAHPPCTYLAGSAAWALRDPDFMRYPGVGYHQKVAAGTLTGAARRRARAEALAFVSLLAAAPIARICLENPIGSAFTFGFSRWDKQTVQPYEFGHDASKATTLTLKGLPRLEGTRYIPPRITADGKERWANQTDSGQNRLSPGPDRGKERSRTYRGLAEAMAAQWGMYIEGGRGT